MAEETVGDINNLLDESVTCRLLADIDAEIDLAVLALDVNLALRLQQGDESAEEDDGLEPAQDEQLVVGWRVFDEARRRSGGVRVLGCGAQKLAGAGERLVGVVLEAFGQL